jgi:hypothetical protein
VWGGCMSGLEKRGERGGGGAREKRRGEGENIG